MPTRVRILCSIALLAVPLALLTLVGRGLPAGNGLEVALFEAAPAAGAQVSSPFYNGLPDSFPRSGKFVNVTRGLSSLGDTEALTNVFNIEIRVQTGSVTKNDFELRVFDGDMGNTTWDRHDPDPDNVTFRLFVDGNKDGQVCDPARSPMNCTSGDPDENDVEIYSWPADEMLDDAWCTLNPDYVAGVTPVCLDGAALPQEANAANADGYGYYHLIADWDSTDSTDEQNNFKVSVEATEFYTDFISTPYLLKGTTIGFEGFGPSVPLPSTPFNNYDGIFEFFLLVDDAPSEIELWDGDLDLDADTDDANSPALPPFQVSPVTLDQGALPGSPPDDSEFALLRQEPGIYYEFSTPMDTPAVDAWTATNANPSGDKEWERFLIQRTDVAIGDEDAVVPAFPDTNSDLYRWSVQGADSHNTLFFSSAYDTFPLQSSSLGDYVWLDEDQDGVQDAGEPGVEGVTVELYVDIDGDGVLSAADNLLDTTTTNANGFYLFSPLNASNYLVVIPASEFEAGGDLFETVVTTAGAGTDDELDSDGLVDGENRTYAAVNLPGATHDRSIDFGFHSDAGSLGNRVWDDEDQDGIQDGDEDGINGVEVQLWRDNDGDGVVSPGDDMLDTQTTSGDGEYLFVDLDEACYIVMIPPSETGAGGALEALTLTEAMSAGSTVGDDSNGVAQGDSSVSAEICLPAGTDDLTIDFGFYSDCPTITLCPVGDPSTSAGAFDVSVDEGAGTVTIRATMARWFADTAYGANSTITGWPSARTFDKILGSDKLELTLSDGDGAEAMRFTMDLLGVDAGAPSGYATSGIDGGGGKDAKHDGTIDVGNVADVLEVRTSISENLNNLPGGVWTDFDDSPSVNADYTGSAEPDWDWDTWYEVTVSLDAFGTTGFGSPSVTGFHSSPSKTGNNTIEVEECSCPAGPPVDPPPAPFDCDKPIDVLIMIWDGTATIDVTVWKGAVGSTLLGTVEDVAPGTAVKATGYAGSPNDVYWELFDSTSGDKLGESAFHMSCSDDDMDGSEDCGMNEGNNKANDSGLINDWLLAGMTDSLNSFECLNGAPVVELTPGDPGGGGGGTCSLSGQSTLKVGGRNHEELKWKIENTGSSDAEITEISVSWPSANGDLKEIKLGSKKIYAPDLAPTSATIDSGWDGSAHDRTIDDGKTGELKLKFKEHNVSDNIADYTITVTFDNGCVVEL